MPSPDYVLALREKIGHDPLWLPGVCGVVFDDAGRVLLGQRSDNGRWALITGILEPGEQPAPGLVREIMEETGVLAVVEHLVGVDTVGPIIFPNGDACEFLNVVFRCRYISGKARVNDDESLAVGWFAVADLPDIPAGHLANIQRARAMTEAAHFEQ
ncbi:NUDIX domain-containing protein [Pseudarthrobacter sp. PS3-L1]|uniref:NUDIX hydrolase n=1 Tax=Pseudarthrobacter sp. PS3-L1 TaxID=3046207 RepID=UPI0024BA1510|nr:NUDIX domain-containing protein [Pseudarthrobacter sp. PS3-L1]MDJ0319624.1 NUDIX domain-containing protein [Pseudarthrobacter sp. PS3-L1]